MKLGQRVGAYRKYAHSSKRERAIQAWRSRFGATGNKTDRTKRPWVRDFLKVGDWVMARVIERLGDLPEWRFSQVTKINDSGSLGVKPLGMPSGASRRVKYSNWKQLEEHERIRLQQILDRKAARASAED